MTIVVKDDKRVGLRADPSRAIWRQLSAIATLRCAGDLGGPVALRNVLDSEAFDLWAGALVTHPMQIAKLVDTVESTFHRVPFALPKERDTKFTKRVSLMPSAAPVASVALWPTTAASLKMK